MPKAKKISTNELIQIIQKYISSNPYIGKLKYADLVSYSKKIGYSNLIYQDFSRNLEIRQIFNEFNEKNSLLNANKLNPTGGFKKITLNIETIVDTYGNDKKTQKAILNIFKDSYNKAFERIQLVEEENTKLRNELNSMNILLNKTIEKNKFLKSQLKTSKEDLKEKKKINQEIRVMNLVEYLINKNCVSKLNKNDIVEVMKNIYYPNTLTSDLVNTSNLNDIIYNMNTVVDNDEDTETNNIIPLNPNFFD
ncbi:hypothetical protein [Clostridium perfringens]|uniref:hypothetical protein n=1 Tax=Clostridium perfringens TaxID=1502 RepID=UPI0023F934A0|nr:hypothetical protein [Clostridium perfringens]MDU1811745.1 hypothetical protein [Clostridium perfringens]WEV20057.1 hypothetical protein PL323_05335 [Clostridium perfringens D]